MRTIQRTKFEKQVLKEELEERLIINHILSDKPNISDLKTTPINSKAKYDCTFVSASTKIIADAKIRKIPYTYQYIKQHGLFVETYKYDNLIKMAESQQAMPYYINYIPSNQEEGFCILINLMEIEFKNKNVDTYINRYESIQSRHIIDMEKTNKELIYINYKELIEENKNILNEIYKLLINNNTEMINLLKLL